MNYKIYKLTVPNGKVYIGMTKLKLKDRWNKGKNYRRNIELFNAITQINV